MSNLSKELIRQIIADGKFSTPKDIGEYLKDMFRTRFLFSFDSYYLNKFIE